ncbi:hypothetical protein EXW62_22525 [Bacillus mycoides]|nr:hypothetical protein EXW62_22525 [Bacillus mycoides]
MFQGFLSLYLWANNQWGWTRPPLIKVSLYSLEQKHRGSKIYYNRMKRGKNLAERESGDAGEG